jgi:hypothetical protein
MFHLLQRRIVLALKSNQDVMNSRDDRYLKIILDRLETCKAYRPKFGTGHAVTIEDFKKMYGEDPFYSWFGLDNIAMYTAHKAAGGITSVYRQIGLGSEEIFRQMLKDQFGISDEQVGWSYEITTTAGRKRRLSLDGRIAYEYVANPKSLRKIKTWVQDIASHLEVAPKVARALDGAVFEVRQGYKSKDSKRQNADIANITGSYARGYLPVFTLLSGQIDNDIAVRYRNSKCPVLIGSLSDSPFHSTYAFCKQVIGYDLAGFFRRNSETLSTTIEKIIGKLLTPE